MASLPKSFSGDEAIIELELCMSGRVETASDRVLLKPSIWIHCGSKRCRDEIRKTVTDLSYLRAFIFASTLLGSLATRPAALPVLFAVQQKLLGRAAAPTGRLRQW